MSLEAAVAKLTEALERNSDLLEKVTAGIGKGGAAPAKPDKDEAKPKTTSGRTSTRKASGSKAKSKDPLGDLCKEASSYLEDGDKAGKPERAANLKSIVEHFGVAKLSQLEADNVAEAQTYLTAYINGEEPDFQNEEAAADEAEEESPI